MKDTRKKDIKICLSYFIVPNKICLSAKTEVRAKSEERRANSEERRAKSE